MSSLQERIANRLNPIGQGEQVLNGTGSGEVKDEGVLNLEGIKNPELRVFLEELKAKLPDFDNGDFGETKRMIASRLPGDFRKLGFTSSQKKSKYLFELIMENSIIIPEVLVSDYKRSKRYYYFGPEQIIASGILDWEWRHLERTGRKKPTQEDLKSFVSAVREEDIGDHPSAGFILNPSFMEWKDLRVGIDARELILPKPEPKGSDTGKIKKNGFQKNPSTVSETDIVYTDTPDFDDEQLESLEVYDKEKLKELLEKIPEDKIDDFSPERFGVEYLVNLAVMFIAEVDDAVKNNRSINFTPFFTSFSASRTAKELRRGVGLCIGYLDIYSEENKEKNNGIVVNNLRELYEKTKKVARIHSARINAAKSANHKPPP